jgi:hypothetical protein
MMRTRECGVPYVLNMMFGLMPLSTIFQFYRGGQFYWWKKTGVPGEYHRPVVSQ